MKGFSAIVLFLSILVPLVGAEQNFRLGDREIQLQVLVGEENLAKSHLFEGPEWTDEMLLAFRGIYPRNAISESSIPIDSGSAVYRRIVEGIVNQYLFWSMVEPIVSSWISDDQRRALENSLEQYISARDYYDEARIKALLESGDEDGFNRRFQSILADSPTDLSWLPTERVYSPTKALEPYSSAVQVAFPRTGKNGDVLPWAFYREYVGIAQMMLLKKMQEDLETLQREAKNHIGKYQVLRIVDLEPANESIVGDYIKGVRTQSSREILYGLFDFFESINSVAQAEIVELSGIDLSKNFSVKPWEVDKGTILRNENSGVQDFSTYWLLENQPIVPDGVDLTNTEIFGHLYRFAVDFYFGETYDQMISAVDLPNDFSIAPIQSFFLRPTIFQLRRSPFFDRENLGL